MEEKIKEGLKQGLFKGRNRRKVSGSKLKKDPWNTADEIVD